MTADSVRVLVFYCQHFTQILDYCTFFKKDNEQKQEASVFLSYRSDFVSKQNCSTLMAEDQFQSS